MELSAPPRLTNFLSTTPLKSRAKIYQRILFPSFAPFQPSVLSVNHLMLIRMDPKRPISCSALVGGNGSTATDSLVDSGARVGEVKRITKETNVSVKVNLDGSGVSDSSTGIPFLDHMLDQLASHGMLDVHVKATGDIHIDDHHTNEDVALAIGTALLQALGDRKGINRFGDFSAPLDEALIHVSLDLSGRPHLSYNLDIPTQRVGTYDTQLVEHFFQSLVNTSGMTLHIWQLAGRNSHHIIEATFKAFARSLRQATEYDPRRRGTVPRYRLKHRRVNIRAVKHWCRQILKGLLYLHSHDPPVIHRDLKCDNIFINGNQGEVKIGDLGLAAILCKAHAASCVGTPEFMAPEVYNEEYNELVDIYSFGMCILEMVTFEYPYSECTHPAQIYKKVVSGQKPEALDKVKDPKVRQFVERCLATVSLRLSARELLTDPFLQIDDYNEVPPLVQQPLNGIHNSSISLMNGCTDHPGYGLDELDYHQVYSETSETALFDCPEDDHMAGVDITIKGRRGEDDDIFLRLRIADREGRVRNIYFPFDMENDTALSVAIEMVAELDIIDQDVTKIANMIDGEIANLVPEWKTEPGIEETPYCTSATFCQHCASNGSLFEYVSSNCPTANNFQVVHCATHGSAALHGRFEEITYQVEGSEQCATEGAPVASSQSNGAQYTDIWAQRDEHELSWEGLKDINCDDSHETLNQSIFNKDEKTIHMDDKSYPYSRNFPSNPVADCALLDYENDFRQELRWLKAKYQLQLRELRGLQLAVKPKYSSLAPNSDSSELEHRKDGGVSRQTVSTQLKMQDNKPHLKSSPSGRKFTSYSTDAEKLCTNVGNQKVHVVAVSGSYSPEPMVTAKDFYTGTLLPHSLNRATSLPVDAVDV